MSDDKPEGVWVVYYVDYGVQAKSIHREEIDALRVVENDGYGNVMFWPFDEEISDAWNRRKDGK